MALPTPLDTSIALTGAADSGLDLVYFAVVYFGGSIGTKYYSTRPVPGVPMWEPKLLMQPSVLKRHDPSAVRFDALNDDLTIRLRNTPENETGNADSGRIQDYMTEVPVTSAKVEIGMAELRTITGGTTNGLIKWDGVYKVDRVDRDNAEVSLYLVDRMLHPGEIKIGSTINDDDWPLAPTSSLGQVRGPVFGKVDGLPLVPVEVGLISNLASEIDDQDGVVDLTGNLELWPLTGYAEIGDEVIYYPVIDKGLKRLGSAASKCTRGTGYPRTTVANHSNGAVVRELYTGKEALLSGAHNTAATTITLQAPDVFPPSGVILVDSEAIRYNSKAGLVLGSLTRGIPVPTIAKVHDGGSPVRTIPVGPDGEPRYRYVIAEGPVDAASNLRVVDEENVDLPYMGGSGTKSLVTLESGKQWSVLDLPARPRFEKFEASGSQVPPEYIFETDGRVDAEGVALPESFARWTISAAMSAAHNLTWPRAIDPSAGTKAVIMSATTGQNVFSVAFNGRFDNGLNSPRRKYGRFRNARLKMKVQYDRQTTIQPSYQIHSNGELVKSGVVLPPSIGGGSGGGGISGTQRIPGTTWGTQPQTKEIRLAVRNTPAGNAFATSLLWCDPMRGYSNGAINQAGCVDGDPRTYISGWWDIVGQDPQSKGTNLESMWIKDLNLYSTSPINFSGQDRLRALIVTLLNPEPEDSPSTDPSTRDRLRTGWKGTVYLYPTEDHTGSPIRSFPIAISRTARKNSMRLDCSGLTSNDLKSLRIIVDQFIVVGSTTVGVTVGDIAISVEYDTDVQGQKEGFLVDGSYFSATATTSPSAIFEQPISLGAVAKEWGRNHDRDPWDFFTASTGTEGLRFTLALPTGGSALQFAMADLVLELEYDALTVVYDGTLLADVDGRVGTPVGGGADEVLQNPIDILAYLVDSPEFFNMDGARSSDDWEDARAWMNTFGFKLARAVTEEITLRDLAATLCAESRLLLLADALELYVRVRWEESDAADSIMEIGDQANPAYALVSDRVPIVNRVEDICNSLGFYYRRNYNLGDFRSVLEKDDAESIRLHGKRRATPNLEWHQSSLGYANGQVGQKEALGWLTDYTLAAAARQWDYATVEVPVSAGESLQRYDVITVNRPRSGYFSTPARVVASQRLTGPLRYQLTLQMNRSTMGYIYVSPDEPTTYIKLAEAGARMDFVIQGKLMMQLLSDGTLRCREKFTVTNASQIDTTRFHDGSNLYLYRERHDGSFAGKHERLLQITSVGYVTLFAYDNGTTTAMRTASAPKTMTPVAGASGMRENISDNSLEFYLANRRVMYIDNGYLGLMGNLKVDQGAKMGSAS